ncbi:MULTISPECIES: hypothetical protein [unclassified Streptomyces]|uniref:hypothetical protein n=1 Tax=unclassified Streptomyces TaxID=2593676 RepID=UPI002E27EC9A|nr:hypothetical protein [Streptomyces sp. NBC_00272]
MRQRASRVQDLIVFLAVLGTAMVLVLRGVAPESLATIAVAVSGLYAAWRGSGGANGDGSNGHGANGHGPDDGGPPRPPTAR